MVTTIIWELRNPIETDSLWKEILRQFFLELLQKNKNQQFFTSAVSS